MLCISKKISKNFALELSGFHMIRSLKDGLDAFEFHVIGDWYKADHKPSLNISLVIFNFVVFELDLYNVNHIPDDPEDAAVMKYRKMLVDLMSIRKKNNGAESKEEDLLLERMDKTWWEMSEGDRQNI
jgi:hypothetical protein